MELKRYFSILMRYWLVIAILTGVGALAMLQYFSGNRPGWTAKTTVGVTQLPSQGDNYSGLYAVQAAEYASDEFQNVVVGSKFLTLVANRLNEGGLSVTADDLKGMLEVERKHRAVIVTVNSSSADMALKTAQILGSTLEASAAEFTKPRQVVANVLDVSSSATPSGGRTLLLGVVRLLAGLLAGVFLAFMLAYLDTSLKRKADVEELGLPVLVEIPAHKIGQMPPPPTIRPSDPIGARLASLQEKEQVGSGSSRN
jgi:capsular polysaccharide biosynthesis protein